MSCQKKTRKISSRTFLPSCGKRKEILAYDVNLVALLFTSIKNRCIDLLRHRIVVKEAVNLMQEEYQATLRMKLASLELFDQSMLSEQDIERIITEVIDSLPEKMSGKSLSKVK